MNRNWIVKTIKGPILDAAYVFDIRIASGLPINDEKIYKNKTMQSLIQTLQSFAERKMNSRAEWDEEDLEETDIDEVFIFREFSASDEEFHAAVEEFYTDRTRVISGIDDEDEAKEFTEG